MNRSDWIKSYTPEMNTRFEIALRFYSSYRRRKCEKQVKITNKYWKRYTKSKKIIPTEGEYKLLTNNKYYQRFIARYEGNITKFKLGELVCVKIMDTRKFLQGRYKYRVVVGMVIEVMNEIIDGVHYSIKFLDYNSEQSFAYPEYRVKKVEFRNLDKIHRRK